MITSDCFTAKYLCRAPEASNTKVECYDKNFDKSKEYVLLYDDHRCAQSMPGKLYSYIPFVRFKNIEKVTLYLIVLNYRPLFA